MNQPHPEHKINGFVRFLVGLVGLLLLGLPIYWHAYPPIRVNVEKDETDAIAKQTVYPSESPALLIALIAGGGAALLYSANGYRLIKFSAAGMSGEVATNSAADQAQSFHKTATEASAVEIAEIDEVDPDATEAPSKFITTADGQLAVYELDDIPFAVISGLMCRWPELTPAPSNLSEFEFATKKKGQGNNPWMIKFNGCPLMKVTFGGAGKTGATIEQQH